MAATVLVVVRSTPKVRAIRSSFRLATAVRMINLMTQSHVLNAFRRRNAAMNVASANCAVARPSLICLRRAPLLERTWVEEVGPTWAAPIWAVLEALGIHATEANKFVHRRIDAQRQTSIVRRDVASRFSAELAIARFK
jgi:hypothetical protein